MKVSGRAAIMLVTWALAATLLRIAAARGELWFDEVWTIQGVQAVESPADIVLKVKHDNNHFLNSFVAYVVGPSAEEWIYRLPAVVAGSLAVWLAWWTMRRSGSCCALFAVTLTGISYLLVTYSSEARGYAYEMLFATAAFAALNEADFSPHVGWEMLIAVTCVLGFLSHPLFLAVYLAVQVWTWWPRNDSAAQKWPLPAPAAILFRTAIPGMFFGWLYWVNLRQMSIGGGESPPIWNVVIQTLSLIVGGPFDPPGAYVAAFVTATITLAAIPWEFRRDPRRAAFYLSVIVLFPLLMLLVVQRSDLYPRYFLMSVLFLLLLWAEFFAGMWQSSRASKVLITGLIVAYLLANGWHDAKLIVQGRSHYAKAIEWLEGHSTGEKIVALVDHAHRQGGMLDFYGRRTRLPKSMELFPDASENSPPAEWYLIHSLDPNFVPPEKISSPQGIIYDLQCQFPFAGLSGWQLCLYHRAAVENAR